MTIQSDLIRNIIETRKILKISKNVPITPATMILCGTVPSAKVLRSSAKDDLVFTIPFGGVEIGGCVASSFTSFVP